jgi:hypothetical protein
MHSQRIKTNIWQDAGGEPLEATHAADRLIVVVNPS